MTPEDTVKTPGGAKKIVLAKKIAGEVKKVSAGEVKKAPAGELTEFLSEWAAVRKRIAKATESRDAAAKAQWKSELAFKAAQEQMSRARDYLAECQEDSAGLQRETEHARTVLAQAEEALERIRKADEEKRWFFSPWW
ncbi:MAG: hypothetical protein WBF17_18825 [Phycisphaerae bacterium]